MPAGGEDTPLYFTSLPGYLAATITPNLGHFIRPVMISAFNYLSLYGEGGGQDTEARTACPLTTPQENQLNSIQEHILPL